MVLPPHGPKLMAPPRGSQRREHQTSNTEKGKTFSSTFRTPCQLSNWCNRRPWHKIRTFPSCSNRCLDVILQFQNSDNTTWAVIKWHAANEAQLTSSLKQSFGRKDFCRFGDASYLERAKLNTFASARAYPRPPMELKRLQHLIYIFFYFYNFEDELDGLFCHLIGPPWWSHKVGERKQGGR